MMNNDYSKLSKKYGTPFYVFYSKILDSNIKRLRNEFEKYYPHLYIGYSFKTNYLPKACTVAKKNNCLAEVVSNMEYSLALKLDFNPDDIIFNGPVKDKTTLTYALKNNSIVNLDSEQDLFTVIELKEENPKLQIKIGLRININLVNNEGKSSVQNGLRFSRFGFTHEMLDKYIPILQRKGVRIHSLHGHTSTTDRAVANYLLISDQLLKIIKKYDLKDVEYFNIGGGFFGSPPKEMDITNKPSFNDYASKITSFLLENEWFQNNKPMLVIEPGASILSNTFELCSKIHQIKKIDKKNLVTVDTSVFEVKPTMHDLNPSFEHLALQHSKSKNLLDYDVVGSTCMEKDVILKNVEMNNPSIGDFIVFKGLGAYTMVFNNMFINYMIPIIEVGNGDNNVLVRRRQDIDNLLRLYTNFEV